MATSWAVAEDGVRVALFDLGGKGTPALLVHATGFHARALAPLAASLGDGLACTGLDLRGHGESGRPPKGDFAWEGFAADVLAAAGALTGGDGSGLVGIGHSLGGSALLLAEASRPGTFAALWCFEPIVVPPELRADAAVAERLAAAASRRTRVFTSRATALERFAGTRTLGRLEPSVLAAYVDGGLEDLPDGTVRLRCDPADEARIYGAGFASRGFERLGEVACPVTVAYGEASDDLGRAVAGRVAGALAAGTLVGLAGLGHLGPLEGPATVARAVARSLQAGAGRGR